METQTLIGTADLTPEALTASPVRVLSAGPAPSARVARRQARQYPRAVEIAICARHQAQLSGRVLEIASRGDGLTDLLAHLATQFTGMAFSEAEAAICADRFPGFPFLSAGVGSGMDAGVDTRGLDAFDDGSFDAIVAGRCGLDGLTPAGRQVLLSTLSRLLAPGGVLILSTHNLACESDIRTPAHQALRRPWQIPTLPRALANRSRLGRHQQRGYGYAVLNDGTRAYSQLSHYVSHDKQAAQLAESDLDLLECVDRNDHPIHARRSGTVEPELHYVARPAADAWASLAAEFDS